jgi:hypothetical protein
MEKRILWDEYNSNTQYPMYKCDDIKARVRVFNGKEFVWLDCFESNGIIRGSWITKQFTHKEANLQIKKCLSEFDCVVCWKIGFLFSELGDEYKNKHVMLSIIGIDKLLKNNISNAPEWYIK